MKSEAKTKNRIFFSTMIAVLLFTNFSYAGLELPQDLVDELHTNLRIAYLYDRYDWETRYQNPLPITEYNIINIDTNGLYGLDAYHVLVMFEWTIGELTTEQINSIVSFVEKGGGVIISDDMGSRTNRNSPLKNLLSKIGIYIKANSDISGPAYIEKDDKILLDHPITTQVESIEIHYGWDFIDRDDHKPVTAVDIDNGVIFLKAPVIGLAKEHGEGRVIFISGYVYEEYSGLRFAVNCVEWVAGYTPPGWSIPADSETVTLRNKYDDLKSDFDSLQREHSSILSEYNSLKKKYEELETSMQAIQEAPPEKRFIPGFPYESIILGLLIVASILWLLQRKRTHVFERLEE